MMSRNASKRFWVFLWNEVTGKAKITKVALPKRQDWRSEEHNEEDQEELLRVAFLLEDEKWTQRSKKLQGSENLLHLRCFPSDWLR